MRSVDSLGMLYFLIPLLFLTCQLRNDLLKIPDPGDQKVTVDAAASTFFQQNIPGDDRWIASDGAISIPLNNGAVLWMMGDSYIGNYDTLRHTVPCLFQVRNSVLLQKKGDWKMPETLLGTKKGIKSFFKKDDGDSTWFWPGHGFQWKNQVYVYLAEFRNNGQGGNLGFESTNTRYFAKINADELSVAAYQVLPDFNGIDFTDGFIISENEGYVYAFGHAADFIESNIFVARLPLSDLQKWQFWNGKDWSAAAGQAKPVAKGASNGVAVQKYKDKFVIVSTEFSVNCDMGKSIFAATATSPTGPFTERQVIYTIPDRKEGHTPFWYTPALHPQYINDEGILLTYCINGYGNCYDACTDGRMDPDVYRPRAIRVPYGMLP